MHCSHAVHLSRLHLSPNIKSYLGVGREFEKAWAVSELIQWVYRTALRNEQPVELYIACAQMKSLLEEWLYEDDPVLELVA